MKYYLPGQVYDAFFTLSINLKHVASPFRPCHITTSNKKKSTKVLEIIFALSTHAKIYRPYKHLQWVPQVFFSLRAN